MASVAESDRKSSPRLQVHFNIGTDAAHIHGGFLATLTARCEQSKIPYQGVPVGTINGSSATDAEAYSQVSHGPVEIRDRQTTFLRGSKSRTAGDDCT